jgi:hypothetical protein
LYRLYDEFVLETPTENIGMDTKFSSYYFYTVPLGVTLQNSGRCSLELLVELAFYRYRTLDTYAFF